MTLVALNGNFGDDNAAEIDALSTRILILEAALECIAREAELADRQPDLSFLTVRRIASVVRQTLEHTPPPVSQRRPLARAHR